jgi:starch phosphorylase
MEISQPTAERTGRTPEAFRQNIVNNLYYSRGANVQSASPYDIYMALSRTVRNHLVERFRRTVDMRYAVNPRMVYYLSAEYLLGRQLPQNLLYTETDDIAAAAMAGSNFPLEDLLAVDEEPGLGNGGLGRLAACFLDSLATLDIPAVGYGIRYEYGIFRQEFHDGAQVEQPDEWLLLDYPWEFAQPDDMIPVGFGGHTEQRRDDKGRLEVTWRPAEQVMGEPHHLLVPGYGTTTVNFLRLWRARATREFDFRLFDIGDYASAVEHKVHSENISKVLYPNDNTPQGRELRLQQQYFFVACSINDYLHGTLSKDFDLTRLPEQIIFQLNDTHPVIAIPELMRILLDEHGMNWDQAWAITSRCFAYTCHTLLPEALEVWPADLVGRLLPRHLEIIYGINDQFLDLVRATYPGDELRVRAMSIVAEAPFKGIRMAHLAAVAATKVNGVAELHSTLLREKVLVDFARLWPEKFTNVTNGVTPRRFVRMANRPLADLITSTIGDGWVRDLEKFTRVGAVCRRRGFPRSVPRRETQPTRPRLAQAIAAAHRRSPSLPTDSISSM